MHHKIPRAVSDHMLAWLSMRGGRLVLTGDEAGWTSRMQRASLTLKCVAEERNCQLPEAVLHVPVSVNSNQGTFSNQHQLKTLTYSS